MKQIEARVELGLLGDRNDDSVAAKVSDDFVDDVTRKSVDDDWKLAETTSERLSFTMSENFRENVSDQSRGRCEDGEVCLDTL